MSKTWYRAMCLDKPMGPWREDRKLAQEDLVDHDLGEYTEWGTFYITVPGDIQIRYWWEIRAAA